jgi:pantothenate kinase type III
MRLDAMHHFTAALPQCFIENAQCIMHNTQLGLTTHSAILNGAYWGIVHEINGYIERYSREYDGLKVILTGGLFNLPIADYRLQITNDNVELLFEPMLVPKGLNYIANSFE